MAKYKMQKWLLQALALYVKQTTVYSIVTIAFKVNIKLILKLHKPYKASGPETDPHQIP